MTEPEIRELLPVWMERLRLRDWVVKLEFVDAWTMDSIADCTWRLQDKRARIRLKKTDHVEPFFDADRDAEWTLVHELLHLHFAPLRVEAKTPEGTHQEIAIDLIAGALVALHRSIPKT